MDRAGAAFLHSEAAAPNPSVEPELEIGGMLRHLRKLAPRRGRTPERSVTPEVSVVIGSYNRIALLRPAIDSVRNNLRGIAHEIIVVDGGSDDGAVPWLCAQRDVILILQHNRELRDGRMVARRSWGYFMNLGFKTAQGEYVLMLSDDCVLLPGAVPNALQAARAQREAGRNVGGVAFYFRNWPLEQDYYVQRTIGDRLMVNHGLFLHSALQEVKWADEDTYRFYKADGDLNLRLWAAGYEVIDCTSSIVEHYMDAQEELRNANSAVLEADRKAYLATWRRALARRGRLAPGGKQTLTYSDPHDTAWRAFGAVNAGRGGAG
jgi:GT2 family glycosyltransferase